MAFVAPLIPAIGSLASSLGPASLLLGGSTGLAAGTAIMNGNYAAAVAKNNAKIEEQNAARISEAAQLEQMRSDQDFAALAAEQLAAQGASGFDILGASQTRSRMLTRRTRDRQAVDIRREGEAGSQQALQEAANYRGEAKHAKTQGYLEAAGHVLDAASTFAGGGSGSFIPRRKKQPWNRSPNWYGK